MKRPANALVVHLAGSPLDCLCWLGSNGAAICPLHARVVPRSLDDPQWRAGRLADERADVEFTLGVSSL